MACDIQKHGNPSSKVDSDTTTFYGWPSQLGTQTQAQRGEWATQDRRAAQSRSMYTPRLKLAPRSLDR